MANYHRHLFTSSLSLLFLQLLKGVLDSGSRLVLLKFLSPQVFGSWAYLLIFFNLAASFGKLQTAKAIIVEDPSRPNFSKKFSVAFTLEIAATLLTALILIIAFQIILRVTQHQALLPLSVPLALCLPLAKLSYPRILWTKNLTLHRGILPTTAATLTNSLVSITLAATGQDIRALLAGLATGLLTEAVLTWKLSPQKPRLQLDIPIAKQLLRFGLPLTGTSLIAYYYWNIDDFLVGTWLGTSQLGFYWLAFKIPHNLLQSINQFSNLVLTWWTHASSNAQLLAWFSFTTRLSATLLFPIAISSLLWGFTLIPWLIGSQWLPSTSPLIIFTFLVAFRGTFGHWSSLFILKQKTSWLLTVTLQNATLLTLLAWPATKFAGITGMALAVTTTILLSFPIMSHHTRQLLPISYYSILKLPAVCLLVFLPGYLITHLLHPSPFSTFIIACLSIICYLGTITYFDPQLRNYLKTPFTKKLSPAAIT